MHVERLIKKKSYEEIIFVLRRHPITFVPMLFLFSLLLAVPAGLYILLSSLFPALFLSPIFYPILILGLSTYLLSIYLFMFAQFIDFYLDIWIVTNDRIVDIEQFNLFSRSISELDLFRIQDVTTDVHGFFATLFDYGNVTVKTASQNVNIIFKDVPNPNFIRQKIIEVSDVDRSYHMGDVRENERTV
jgi:membrane protein YdbS with pleckstrin-like domain